MRGEMSCTFHLAWEWIPLWLHACFSSWPVHSQWNLQQELGRAPSYLLKSQEDISGFREKLEELAASCSQQSPAAWSESIVVCTLGKAGNAVTAALVLGQMGVQKIQYSPSKKFVCLFVCFLNEHLVFDSWVVTCQAWPFPAVLQILCKSSSKSFRPLKHSFKGMVNLIPESQQSHLLPCLSFEFRD